LKSFIAGYAGLKGLQMINDQLNKSAEMYYSNLSKLQKKSLEISTRAGSGFGNIIVNDPALGRNTEEGKRVWSTLVRMSGDVLEPDIGKMFDEYSTVRSMTQDLDATEKQKLDAYKVAKILQLVDPKVDAAGSASTWLRFASENNVSLEKASGIVSQGASTTSLDANAYAKAVGPLLGTGGMSMEGILNTFAAFNTAFGGVSPDKAASSMKSIAGKIIQKDSYETGSGMKKFGTYDDKTIAEDRMNELVQAMQGKSTTERQKIISSIVGSSIEDTTTLNYLAKNYEKFAGNRKKLSELDFETFVVDSLISKRKTDPTFMSTARRKANEVGASKANIADIPATRAENLKLGAEAFAEQYGIIIDKKTWEAGGERIAGKSFNPKLSTEIGEYINENVSTVPDTALDLEVKRKILRSGFAENFKENASKSVWENRWNINPFTNKDDPARPELFPLGRGERGYPVMTDKDIDDFMEGKGQGAGRALRYINFEDGLGRFEQSILRLAVGNEALQEILIEMSKSEKITTAKFAEIMKKYMDEAAAEKAKELPAKIKQEDIQ